MAVQDRTATHFPTFTRAARAVHGQVTARYVGTWCVAVTAFALLDAAITFGASYWRYEGDVATHEATVAAIDRFNQVQATMPSADSAWQSIGPAALDLDTSAAVGQVVAATAAFGLLLAVALVLAAHGRTVAGYVASLLPGLSVATMAGLLARTAPMIPTGTTSDTSGYDLGAFPAALRAAFAGILAAQQVQDTPGWWTWTIAATVAALGAVAVHAARRGGTYSTASAAATPFLLDVAVVAATAAATALLTGQLVGETFALDPQPELRLLVVTGLVAVLSVRAAASSRIGTAVALSLGFAVVHGLLYASFSRGSGAPGGWGVGTGGPQVHASTASAVILVVAPVIGWVAAATWTHLASRRTGSATDAPLPA